MKAERGFVASGTLRRPGPVGRLVRLGFGLACGWFLVSLALAGPARVAARFPDIAGMWPWAFAALYLTSDIVNIGFGKAWGRRPQVALLAAALGAAIISDVAYDSFFGPPLAWFTVVWLVYIYAHLALSFLLAAIFAIPGCEMRAVPHLVAMLTNRRVIEHHCPVGPLSRIDAWEANRHTVRRNSDPSI